jgi:ATP-dependent RNA helicase DeaD
MKNETPLTFSDLGLPNALIDTLTKMDHVIPTPIQLQTIPLLRDGHDIIGQAQTGTGKTAAFALPFLCKVNLALNQPQIMVITPTRELALQVSDAFKGYAASLRGLKVLPVYGGADMSSQLKQLKQGVHVVVGTPGRMMDHLERGSLKLNSVSMVVLDEADEMLRMGFIDDVNWIFKRLPEKRQIALFSATMPEPIRKISKTYLHSPKEVTIQLRTKGAETINHYYCEIDRDLKKTEVLLRLLQVTETTGVLIFVSTKQMSTSVAEKLESYGLKAAPLNGDMTQNNRERTVTKFKRGLLDIIVATDVAARGLDIDRISHVINFDMPHDIDSYIHRIGRTGRAGRTGNAILLMARHETNLIRRIEAVTKKQIMRLTVPSYESLRTKKTELYKNQILEAAKSKELILETKFATALLKESTLPIEKIVSAIIHLSRERTELFKYDEYKEKIRVENPTFTDHKQKRHNRPDHRYSSNRRGRYTS